MRILVDHGGHALLNMGDLAMLQVALNRLYAHWPDARIQVLTDSADRLLHYYPRVEPLLTKARDLYGGNSTMLWPGGWRGRRFERWLLVNHPGLVLRILERRARAFGIDMRPAHAYIEAIRSADLVFACGGGYLTDMFPWMVDHIYRTVMLAKHFRKPLAIVGQGLGPLKNPTLRRMAAEILNGTDLIGLREHLAGYELLDELQVPRRKAIVTGDDAIELAYERRLGALGSAIGVNLRIAEYSGVSEESAPRLKDALHAAAKRYRTNLRPLYVSFYANDHDTRAIQYLINADGETSGDDLISPTNSAATPAHLIDAIGECRIVVTGSYHGAVFALAQGIPAIGIAGSKYYLDKFAGVAAQFGAGCRFLQIDAPGFEPRLMEMIDAAWTDAEECRPNLLQMAAAQIAAGKIAYERIAEIAERNGAV